MRPLRFLLAGWALLAFAMPVAAQNAPAYLDNLGQPVPAQGFVLVGPTGALVDAAHPLAAGDPNNAAFTGVQAMTVGNTYTAGRSWLANCSVAGNVAVTFSDASTTTVPASIGLMILPFAVTSVNSSGTTATCTFANLK